jgi:AGZA family xanthine/uracil permease-like MFS transporter
MSYIIIVNPVILSVAGVPFGPAMVATILAAAVASIACGIYARKPFAMAPYMGENAFFTYSIVIALGVTWNVALGVIFLAGILFLLISFSGFRNKMVNAIPRFMPYAWGAAIGLFLMFIGLANAGIAIPGTPGAPVQIGYLDRPEAILVFIGIALTLFLYVKKVVGSVLIGTGVMIALGFIIGGLGFGTDLPHTIPQLWGPIPDWGQVLFKLDIGGAMSLTLIPVILVVFFMDFLDTAGTMLGLGAKGGFLDDDGHLPGADKVMQVDAAATAVGGLFGTSTVGAFIESATGIEQGGRTGMTAVVVGSLFLATIALTPFFVALPVSFLQLVAAPALVVIGVSMLSSVQKIDMDDMAQLIPTVLTIGFMLFTFNIGFGLAIGLVAYPLVMAATGRAKKVEKFAWVLLLIGALLFLIYPYR